jgi:suppressor for copper-sensitivity B
MMRGFSGLVLAAAIAFMPRAGFADAASAWQETEQTAVRLIAAATAVGTADALELGLQFRLKPGWKIYWRAPGDAGFPPRVDWSGSTNLASADIAWPAPERFSVLGFETLGYSDAVILPITAHPGQAGQGVGLKAKVDYLTCKEICIPYTARMSLGLPAATANPSKFAYEISRFRAKVPSDGTDRGFAVTAAWADGNDKTATLMVAAQALYAFDRPDIFVEAPAGFTFGVPAVTLGPSAKTALLKVPMSAPGGKAGALVGTAVTLTLVDGPRAVEKNQTVLPAPPSGLAAELAAAAPVKPQFALILGLALLGGLILNLMPCVLPVLCLKLMGAIALGGAQRRQVELGFLATAGGIVTAFLVLAGSLVGLKLAGHAVGWGIQFQQPLFLIGMAMMVMLFACNLWGFFEIRLPGWMADAGTTGSAAKGLAGHFLTGAFATLLATPCTAPFLGTAVGFALSRGPLDILAVFTAVGAGLALPYLLVAAYPGLAMCLPKPGRWMIHLRRILGVVLAATAVWLLTVLAGVTGEGAAGVAGLIIALLVILMLLRPRLAGGARRGLDGAIGALVMLVFTLPSALPPSTATSKNTDSGPIAWTYFDPAAIPPLVAQGKIVFVDITADWCITCIANKSLVLERAEIAGRLDGQKIIAMQGDWTRPDPMITAYLMRFGRYGIPFNAVYGPGASHGIALSELLTPGAVMAALDSAAVTAKKRQAPIAARP